MNISLHELHKLLASAVTAGVQAYKRDTQPRGDRIKRAEAKRFLERRGYKPVMLDRWAKAGLITPVKGGDAKNSAVWYSLAEIMQTICAANLKEICNDDIIQES